MRPGGRRAKSRAAFDGSATGSMTVELAVLAPVVFLFVLAAVGLGRFEGARQEVTDAAHAGAQAASVARGAGQAPGAAVDASLAALRDQPHMCVRPTVATDTSTFAAGGSVRVTVDCRVSFSDLLLPGLPGSATVRATETAPVDPYRVVG